MILSNDLSPLYWINDSLRTVYTHICIYIHMYFIFFSPKIMNIWRMSPTFMDIAVPPLQMCKSCFAAQISGSYRWSPCILLSLSSFLLIAQPQIEYPGRIFFKVVIHWFSSASGKWESISKEGFYFLSTPLRGQKEKTLPDAWKSSCIFGRWMKVPVLDCKSLPWVRWLWLLKDQRVILSPFSWNHHGH